MLLFFFGLVIYQRKMFAKTLICSFHLGFFSFFFKWICNLQVKPIPLRQQQFLHDPLTEKTVKKKINPLLIIKVVCVKL